MFSKHRSVWLWVSSLLFALLMSFGIVNFQPVLAGEGEFATTHSAYETTMIATEAGTAVTAGTAVPENTEQGNPHPSPAPSSFFIRFCASVAIFIGLCSGLLYLLLVNQPHPYLGPETEVFLLFVLINLIANSWLKSPILFPAWLSFLGLLGGLISWGKRGFSLSWLGIHRLACALGGKSRYRFYPVTVCLSALVFSLSALGLAFSRQAVGIDSPAVALYLNFSTGSSFYTAVIFWLAGCALLSILLLLRYEKSADHLLTQIHSLESGSTPPPREDLFTREQEILWDQQTVKSLAIQKAVAEERFKVELIANVSHDLRTPLTSILGYGELLEGENLTEQGGQYLEKLNRKTRYMRDLVDSLFDLTKVSSGTLKPDLQEIDLIRLLEQTIGLEEDILTARELAVRRKYCKDRFPILTDGNRMHQVFVNLLENAIKYALKGSRIYLTLDEDSDTATVTLTNTASYEMDFSPEEIMQRFARGDKARSTQGSGLGLAIAQTYTESVGGSFRIAVDGDQFKAMVTLPKTEREP